MIVSTWYDTVTIHGRRPRDAENPKLRLTGFAAVHRSTPVVSVASASRDQCGAAPPHRRRARTLID
eukprot:2013093-Prymnesium_polylepis.2